MFDRGHMSNVARELREEFDFFLSNRLNPKNITVGNDYVDDLWCILIDNWLTIVPCKIDYVDITTSKGKEYKQIDGYELQVITVESNYPHEPDWIDYAIIGKYSSKEQVKDATLKYILNQAMEAYGENKYYAQTIMEDTTASVC